MITPEIVKTYTEGYCWMLALALGKVTGWPIAELDGLHALVVHPTRRLVLDIRGLRPVHEVCKKWYVREVSCYPSYEIARLDLRTWWAGSVDRPSWGATYRIAHYLVSQLPSEVLSCPPQKKRRTSSSRRSARPSPAAPGTLLEVAAP